MRFTCSSFFEIVTGFPVQPLLSACGFHLRGDYDVPDELSKLSITSYDQYSSFTRIVTRQLRMNKIDRASRQKIPNQMLLD